jgi:hypothetical protein
MMADIKKKFEFVDLFLCKINEWYGQGDYITSQQMKGTYILSRMQNAS